MQPTARAIVSALRLMPDVSRTVRKHRMSEEKKPEDMMHLPEGVAAAGISADGKVTYILDPFLLNMRWEGLSVNSESFKALSPADRLYRLSVAFLSSGVVLCERAGDAGATLEWPQASVCYYCLHLATELFLKACILRVGREPSKHHEIAELRREYSLLLPGQAYSFQTSWALSAKDLAESFGFEVLHGIDRTPDQLFRYSMDKKGNASGMIQNFTPGYLFNYMTDLTIRWKEIWQAIPMDDG
jgi:hypothetical protein